MLKHMLVGAFAISSLALAAPHGARPAQNPNQMNNNGGRADDRFDAARANTLLRDYDFAISSRDMNRARNVEFQFSALINQELNESRREARGNRNERNEVGRLYGIQSQLSRLQGRMDRRATRERRELFAQVVQLANKEARPQYGRR